MNNLHQLLINKLKNASGKDEFFEGLKIFFEEYFGGDYFRIVKLIQLVENNH